MVLYLRVKICKSNFCLELFMLQIFYKKKKEYKKGIHSETAPPDYSSIPHFKSTL